MGEKRSHMLLPITNLKPMKVKIKWTDVKQKLLKEITRIVSHDTLSDYTYFNKQFEIHTNAIDLKLGAFIIQEGEPINFYSRKIKGP